MSENNEIVVSVENDWGSYEGEEGWSIAITIWNTSTMAANGENRG